MEKALEGEKCGEKFVEGGPVNTNDLRSLGIL